MMASLLTAHRKLRVREHRLDDVHPLLLISGRLIDANERYTVTLAAVTDNVVLKHSNPGRLIQTKILPEYDP